MSDAAVSPQGGGEEEDEEESEEGGGSTAAHLMEALRQFRLHHRGQYRTVLEESLAAYRLRREGSVEGAGEVGRTSDDGDEEERTDSPPSPPPSPAAVEVETGQNDPKSDISAD